MNFKMVFILKFRHGIPIPLRHIGHPASGIFPFPDGDGIIKAFPQQTVSGFCFIRRRHPEILQRAEYGFAGGIKKSLFVGAVIDEEGFALIAGTKMAAQQGEDPVFRFDFAAEDSAKLGETDEALQQMRFAIQMTDCGSYRI